MTTAQIYLTPQPDPAPPPEAFQMPIIPLMAKGMKEGAPFLTELLEERHRQGMERYGVPLTLFNGRSPLYDAMQELVDAFVYLQQAGMEAEMAGNPKQAQMYAQITQQIGGQILAIHMLHGMGLLPAHQEPLIGMKLEAPPK